MTTRPDPTDPREDPVATGARTLLDVLADAGDRGFAAHLVPREGGMIECGSCGHVAEPADLSVEQVHRLEGASDAADLLMVVEATCPGCRTGGTLTLGYGPNASETDEAVLAAIDLDRH